MSEQLAIITTPSEARRYLWAWFAVTLSLALGFLALLLLPPYAALVPGVPGVIAAHELDRTKTRVARRSRAPRTGFFAAQAQTFDAHGKVYGGVAFEEAIRLLRLPRRRWLLLRWLALGMLFFCFGFGVLRSIS